MSRAYNKVSWVKNLAMFVWWIFLRRLIGVIIFLPGILIMLLSALDNQETTLWEDLKYDSLTWKDAFWSKGKINPKPSGGED